MRVAVTLTFSSPGRSQPPEMLNDGTLAVANSWEIMTDLPWLQALAAAPGLGGKTQDDKCKYGRRSFFF